MENSLSIVYWAIKSTRRATGVPVTWLETEDCISSLQGREAFTLVWYSHVCCIIVYNCTMYILYCCCFCCCCCCCCWQECSRIRSVRRWNSLQYCMISLKKTHHVQADHVHAHHVHVHHVHERFSLILFYAWWEPYCFETWSSNRINKNINLFKNCFCFS